MKKNKQKEIFSVIMCILFAIYLQRNIIKVNLGIGYVILELLFTISIVVSLGWMNKYLFLNQEDNKYNKYYLMLFLIQLFAFMPLHTQNFLYGDDLWAFANKFNGDLAEGLYYSRPFIKFLHGMIPNISFECLNLFRTCNSVFLFLFGCILFKYICEMSGKVKVAFVISAVMIASCAAVDCIAYASIYPINISLLLSAISFVVYSEARKLSGKRKYIVLLQSVIILFAAFCFYQIGTPVVFFMYVVSEKYKKSNKEAVRFGEAFFYLIYYAITAILYMSITKILQILTGVSAGQTARGEIILSIEQLGEKIQWFLLEVCPQTFTRIVSTLCGNSLFSENNMFYSCTYKTENIQWLVLVLGSLLIIGSIMYTGYKLKSFVYGIIAVAAIPLSFWPFLVLPESCFLTYYSMGIISLFIWYLVDGLDTLKDILGNKIEILNEQYEWKIISFCILLMIIQSNNYSENAWVNHTRDSYEFIANHIVAGLEGKENVDTIIVQGSMSPYVGGHDYVCFAVNNILKESGYDPEKYNIVQSENGFYLLTFSDNEVAQMEKKLGKEKMQLLFKYYVHDELYSRWCYNGMALQTSEISFLRECFETTGQIIRSNENSVWIDMKGFNIRNPF